MSNSQAVGVAYSDPEFQTCYARREIGYAVSASGNVTQLTNKTTGVTLNTPAGRITLNNASLPSYDTAVFRVTNDTISPKDVVIVNTSSGGTVDAYWAYVASIGAGYFDLGVYNNTTGALAESITLNFATLHCQCAS
jgi:hypothetical protein